VLDRSFLPGDTAVMVPHTDDGRVLFAIPWYGHVLVGTTDVETDDPGAEPVPTTEETDYLLEHIARYLARDPARTDIRSAFAGLRPLADAGSSARTAAAARDHDVEISASGMVTIAGGKWTTYRKMAEDTVDAASAVAGIDDVPCATHAHRIHGHHEESARFGVLAPYGSDAERIKEIIAESPRLAERLDPDLDAVAAEVVWATRHEMARTVEDVLARRTRGLFVDAAAARRAAPRVAEIMARVLGRDEAWRRGEIARFDAASSRYLAGESDGEHHTDRSG
jgi:glycerol-3-phosphate dehydrogenase